MTKNLLAAFITHVESRPHETALIISRQSQIVSITWSHLACTVMQTMARLRNLQQTCQPSEPRIVYSSDNGLSDIVLALACQLAGLVEIPIDSRLGMRTIGQLRSRSGGVWLDALDHQTWVWESFQQCVGATDYESVLDRFYRAAQRDSANQPALVLWTSGTTGEPKGVVLSEQNLVGNAAAKLAAVPQSTDDIRLTTLPLCHAYARTCDFGTWLLSGCKLAVSSGFVGWQTLGPHVRPTLANTVPSLAKRLLDCESESLGIDRLRILGCGGAAMSEREFTRWRERGVTVIQGYGLTEAGPVICSATPENAMPGHVGTLVEGWESEIRDGRLFVRGPHTMLGYLDDALATSQRIDHDGWMDTGDIVDVNQETDQFRIVGRADETIVLDNGRKIHPARIERLAEQLPAVRHAMLVGNGRSTTLWIDTHPPRDDDSIKAQITALFEEEPPWHRPREVKFFDPPLSVEKGEITLKGVIRRALIGSQRL